MKTRGISSLSVMSLVMSVILTVPCHEIRIWADGRLKAGVCDPKYEPWLPVVRLYYKAHSSARETRGNSLIVVDR
jgi:hypothetical protein